MFSLLAIQNQAFGWIWPRNLYYFSIVIVANYHLHGVLEQPKCILPQFWMPEVWNKLGGVGGAASFPEASGMTLFHALSTFWYLLVPSGIFQYLPVAAGTTAIFLCLPAHVGVLMWSCWSTCEQVLARTKSLFLVITLVCFTQVKS